MPNNRIFPAVLLLALSMALAVNSLLGPQFMDVIGYPLSETLLDQTRGLELFSLAVLSPLCVVAAVLNVRRHRAAPALAMAIAGYVAYMFVQYILGPGYEQVPPFILWHLALFITGTALLLSSWRAMRTMPALPRASARRWAIALFGLSAFLASRYVALLQPDQSLPADMAADVAMYWSIFLLDLGIVLPLALATITGLLRGSAWATPALYGLMGWFTLVPSSVAVMGLVMLINDAPHANRNSVVVLGTVAALFAVLAVKLYLPLFRTNRDQS